MEIKYLTCIRCPLGCALSAQVEGDKVTAVSGNRCKRGHDYAVMELTSPTRTVTSIVKVKGGEIAMVSAKTENDIPKDKIFACMEEIKALTVSAPIALGQVLITDVAGTGVNVIATKNVNAK